MKMCSVEQMRRLEAEANQKGVSYLTMMERAGRGLAGLVEDYLVSPEAGIALGLVGSGNNGGDVLVALKCLLDSGWQAKAYLAGLRDAEDRLVDDLVAAGGEICKMAEDQEFNQLEAWLESAEVLLDGVLGTGIQLPLREDIARLLAFVKDTPNLPVVVAVDCPSGVDCASGAAAPETIPADLTVCMQAVKSGLLAFPAFETIGDLEVVDLGFPADMETWGDITTDVIDSAWVSDRMPERPLDGHKGTFGTVMLVVGSINYTGAAYLAGKASARIGAGLVRMAVPGPLHGVLAGQFPEATWFLLPHEMGVISENALEVVRKNLEKVDVLVLGPGWGTEDTTAAFLNRLLAGKTSHARGSIGFVNPPLDAVTEDPEQVQLPPLVIDADGLKLLARIPEWHTRLPGQSVLTPHPGEMKALTGLEISEINQNRVEVARKFAQIWGQVVILKGAISVIAAPDGRSAVIPVATSALAHGGTGDVLAGMLAGLKAQGLAAYEASVCAAWIHAQAGLTAADWMGHPAAVLASDLLDSIGEVLESLEG